MGILLRLLLLLLLLLALWRLLSGIVEGASGRRRTLRPGVPLVRDPVCGTFVVRSQAVSLGQGSEARFFCSERCREAYMRR